MQGIPGYIRCCALHGKRKGSPLFFFEGDLPPSKERGEPGHTRCGIESGEIAQTVDSIFVTGKGFLDPAQKLIISDVILRIITFQFLIEDEFKKERPRWLE